MKLKMNPNSTMFDPRPYPYMRCRLSLASIQDHPYGGAGRGTRERSHTRKLFVRPNPLALFWHVPEASGAWLLGFLLSLGCSG
ncbi:hypothetical protein ERO13_A09G087100v2 [Gossypium hirsutum]|nr:hypothetical protein ES319_A09G091100v1 [Gossypium barbadense]KAG4183101.1 hypothetical protein ERO13_A09G087100v2 [Gossypium hirsutum]TYH02085.1 hypothetical protein ES288_A09G110200v1 [Gossypium darwinii]TYI09937.1 hypothetical protein ES332_A09G105600v1 [Gossypium tomentosum]TYJ18053.1 hypothetical protein E1A91_A09G095400v1 [Gossypium mustelinum]